MLAMLTFLLRYFGSNNDMQIHGLNYSKEDLYL